MLHVVTDQKYAPGFCEWLAERCPGANLPPSTTHTIACVSEAEDGNVEVLAVCALSNWQAGSVECTVATDGSKRQKASREFIWTCFDYAFNFAGKSRIACHSRIDNFKSHAVQEMLGLKRVAVLKDHYGEDQDAVLYGITKREWLAGPWANLGAPTVNTTTSRETV